MTVGMSKRGVLFTAAFTLLLCAGVARAQERGQVAGIVQDLKGTVLARGVGGGETRLHPQRDRGRAVYVGESFRCQKGSTLRLRLGGQLKVINGPSPWFTVEPGMTEADRYKKALDEYVRTGGRSRGEPPQIFSPAANGSVTPATFVIRWTPRPPFGKVSLAIREARGAEVWRQDSVEEGGGSHTSPDVRRALTRHREGGGRSTLILVWREEGGGQSQVTFNLLSAEEERAVNEALASWDAETDPVMRHVGRAAVYHDNWMLAQAADEYERALESAPESHTLLLRTILAQRETGNLARAEELAKRLP